MTGSVTCDSMRNSSSDSRSYCSYDGPSSPSPSSPTFRGPNGIHHYLPPMDDEKMRVFAVMAFDLLVADDELHPSLENFSCPSYDCKETFTCAKELIRHIPFCQQFATEKVYCNVCKGDDCYLSLICPSPKQKAVSTITRIWNRLSVSRPSSRQSSHCDEFIYPERASKQSGEEKMVIPLSPQTRRATVSPSTIQENTTSIGAPDISLFELHGKDKPQELPTTEISDPAGCGSSISPSLSIETGAGQMLMKGGLAFHSSQEDLNMGNVMPELGELAGDVGDFNQNSIAQGEFFPPNAFASDSQSQMSNGYVPSPTSAFFDDALHFPLDLADQTPAYFGHSDQTHQDNFQSLFEQPNPAFLHQPSALPNGAAGRPISRLASTSSYTSLASHSASGSPLTMAPQTPAFSPSQESRKNGSPHYSLVPFIEGVYLRCPHWPKCPYFTTGEKVDNYPTYLRKHMETHKGPKFRCSDCRRWFKRLDNLVAHKKNRYCHPQVPVHELVPPKALDEHSGGIPGATGSLKQRRRRSRWKDAFLPAGRRQGHS